MGSELLTALLGGAATGGGILASPEDSYLSVIGKSIAQAGPALINPEGSMGKNIGASFGTALLAGLLGGAAKRSTDTENREMLSVMDDYLAGDEQVKADLGARYPGLPKLGALMAVTKLQNEAATAQKAQELNLARESDILKDTDPRRLTFEQQKGATENKTLLARQSLLSPGEVSQAREIEKAKIGAQGPLGSKKPEEYVDQLRGELSKTPEYQKFSTASQGFQVLLKAKADPSKVSDLDFVYGTIQAIEPGMAVKEGEQAAVQNSQSIPDGLKAQMLAAMNGTAVLKPETREAIIRLAARRYNEYQASYESLRGGLSARATRLTGIANPDISFLPKLGTAEDLLSIQAKAVAEAQKRGIMP